MTLAERLASASQLAVWRLDDARHAPSWDSGEGAFLAGGRWNSKGVRAVYCSLDAALAILEVAVHKGFAALDMVPHVLTKATIRDFQDIRIVEAVDVPNSNWLIPGIPSLGQQTFGDTLLARHRFVAFPSVVSRHSWNLVFAARPEPRFYETDIQEPFALDPRLHPPV